MARGGEVDGGDLSGEHRGDVTGGTRANRGAGVKHGVDWRDLVRECSGTAGGQDRDDGELRDPWDSREDGGEAGIPRVRGGNCAGRGCRTCSPGGVGSEGPAVSSSFSWSGH